MSTTQITTAARRIARDASATSPKVTTHYAADGSIIDSHPADMAYTESPAWMADVALTLTGGRIAQREVQDRLDAMASYDAESGMSRAEWVTYCIQAR